MTTAESLLIAAIIAALGLYDNDAPAAGIQARKGFLQARGQAHAGHHHPPGH